MNVTLTNKGTAPLPAVSTDGPGLAESLEPELPFALSGEEINVVILGDKPGFLESLVEGLTQLAQIIGRILTIWREHTQPHADTPPTITATIQNHGPNALRVCLGSNTEDVQVDAGATYAATAPGYIELRELGV